MGKGSKNICELNGSVTDSRYRILTSLRSADYLKVNGLLAKGFTIGSKILEL